MLTVAVRYANKNLNRPIIKTTLGKRCCLRTTILQSYTMSQSVEWESDDDFTEYDGGVGFCGGLEARYYKCKALNHVPLEYRQKCFWCIAFNILVLTTIITIVAFFNSTSNTADLTQRANTSNELYFIVNNTRIVLYDLENDNMTLQHEAPINSKFSSFEIRNNISSYWIENLIDGTSRIVARMNNNEKVLVQEKRFKPSALAFDVVSENLYATDENAGILIAINVRSGYFLILLTDMIRPRDVVLDSDEGFVFVLQHSHSIVRANMDGSNPIDLFSKTNITALSIDLNDKRLYWTHDLVSIESSDYEGKSRRILLTSTSQIMSLIFANNKLLWIEQNQQDTATLIFSCELATDHNCNKRIPHKIDVINNVISIRSYMSINKTTANPCESNNGNCEQLCLPSGRNNRSCACRMGWQLNADDRTCEEVRDFVLYPYDGVVRTCTLDGKRELFWPTPYLVDKLTVKSEIDFEYDFKNDYFYFSDDHNIHRLNLKSYSGQEVILSIESSDMIIDDIAYDWFTGNMYYGHRHVDATLEHSLVVFNPRLGGSYRKSIKIFDQDDMKARSYALALHPARGYLFVAVTHEDAENTKVFRTKVDGSDFQSSYHFFALQIQDHRFFAIDYESNRIYAIEYTGENIGIAYVEIKSLEMQFPEHPNLVNARTVAVHQRWLYLSNSSSICRFDKETGEEQLVIAPRIVNPAKKIIGVRIASEEVQSISLDNPCAENNGGCEQFCFSGSKATCDCKDGQRVTENGRCHEVD